MNWLVKVLRPNSNEGKWRMDLWTERMNSCLLMVRAAMVLEDIDGTRARGKYLRARFYLLENTVMLVVPGILGNARILPFSSASSCSG